MKPRNILLLTLVLYLCPLLLFLACDRKTPPLLINRRPHVYVSAGPPQGGTSSYYVTIYWNGVDSDGVVEYFLYAIDDTTGWTETRSCQGSFVFAADSLRAGEEFGRWHTFWIKAVDNHGAQSVPYYLTFDARTIAPRTTIISPRCDPEGGIDCRGPLPVGTSLKIVWEGEDPDSRDPSKKPVGYMWRLFNVTKFCQCPFGSEDVELLDLPDYVPDSTSFWCEPTTDTEVQFHNLESGCFWLFGVRAIDEAGAVEPHLRLNYNVIDFKSMPGFGCPTLTVYQGASQHTFPNDGQIWEKQAPVGKQICFCWEGDASVYGGTICGYTYGIDIEDLNDPEEWETDWSLEATSVCVAFEEPGFHYLYIKVKDCYGSEQLGIIELEVIQFLFDRDILLVDDFFDTIPDDAAHDAFIATMLSRCYQYTDSIYVFNTFRAGPGGVPRELKVVDEPPLSELLRYRLIVWVTDASQNQFDTGIHRVVRDRNLQRYLRDGGRLWLFGRAIVRGTADNPERFAYPTEPDHDSFARRYLKISGEVNRPIIGLLNRGDGFKGAIPNKDAMECLPILDIDYAKGGSNPDYGFSKVEAVMIPLQDPDLAQRPDTLYFYRANYSNSKYDNKACSFRFHDEYAGSKLVYMGFPIHMFYDEQAESLGTCIIDWMFKDMLP